MQKKYVSLLIVCMSLPTITYTMYNYLTPSERLLYAAYEGNIQKAQEALNACANPNFKEITGITALHQAAFHGRTEIVKLLLEKGANRSLKNSDGKKPLDVAQEYGHQEIAQLLLN